jgi:hypothetical protein
MKTLYVPRVFKFIFVDTNEFKESQCGQLTDECIEGPSRCGAPSFSYCPVFRCWNFKKLSTHAPASTCVASTAVSLAAPLGPNAAWPRGLDFAGPRCPPASLPRHRTDPMPTGRPASTLPSCAAPTIEDTAETSPPPSPMKKVIFVVF